MRKYKVEDLYATIITDGYYAKDYKRISDIVNKYNGNMTMNYDNKIFKIKIMLIQEKTI